MNNSKKFLKSYFPFQMNKALKFPSFSSLKPPFLTLDTICSRVKKAEYAVRGTIPMKAALIAEQIRIGEGSKHPFASLTELNIGNPQIFGQKPFSFFREVLACCFNPQMIDQMPFHIDVKNRSKLYNSSVHALIGAYSDSVGYRFVRENVARFIQKRDGGPEVPVSNLILTDGASNGIQLILSTILSNENDGVMIPIPQYPLYTALIALTNGQEVPYYLNEESGWQISLEDLMNSIKGARKSGINVKALVVINPGNPTGQVFSEEALKTLIRFCYENQLVILADEVYQENVYKENKKFISMKKVLTEMEEPYNDVELFSFHSTSKGFVGECGIRGGYLELTNINTDVMAQIIKLKSIHLCSNTTGQITTDLMVNPPTIEDCSNETVERYEKEKNELLTSLKRRAEIVTDKLNKMKNVKCAEVEGSMYAFPRVFFSEKIIQEAEKRKMSADLFYTYEGFLYFLIFLFF